MSVLDRRAFVSAETRRGLSLTEPLESPVSRTAPRQPCGAIWQITLPSGERGQLIWRITAESTASVQAIAEDASQVWLRGEGAATTQIIDGLLHVQSQVMTSQGEVRLISTHDAATGRLLYASTNAGEVLGVGGGCVSEPTGTDRL